MSAPDDPASEPDDGLPDGLGPGAFFWVLAVVALNWLIYAVPAALALGAGFDAPLATGTTIALATVDPGWSTLIVATGMAVLAVLAVSARVVQRAFHSGDDEPPALAAPMVTGAVVTAIALPMEWCAGDWMPDVLSVGPLISMAAVLGVAVPLLLLWGTVKVGLGLLGAAVRSPFFAGVVAGLGTMALAPPAAAAASLFLMVQAVEAASELPPPAPAPVQVGDVGLLGSRGSSRTTPDIDDCLRELQRIRDQVERTLRSKYRISDQEAEDIAGEALVSVCVSDGLSSYRNLEAVYNTAARNKTFDLMEKRRGEVGAEALLCLPVYPDEWRLKSEIVIADQAFGRLDSRTQEALRMWAQDEPHAVIASHLGITSRMSRDLVSNGKKSMRRFVKKECAYPGGDEK